MRTNMYKLDTHTALLPQHPISRHTNTLRHPWALFPSHLIRQEQTAITVSASQFSSHRFPYLLAGLACNNLLTWDEASLTCWPGCTLWAKCSECLLSFQPSNSIQQLFILFMSPHVGRSDIVFTTWAKWLSGLCQDVTEEQWLVSINQFQLTLLETIQSKQHWKSITP